MEKAYDLIVIGSGSAGATAAYRCREAGWSVALIDSRPFGGTCALRGCDPKKVLVGVAEAMDHLRRMEGKGIAANGARMDWPALQRFKRTFTDSVPDDREQAYTQSGIVALHGTAHFTSPTQICVNGENFTARHVLIASGAKPATLGIPGEEHAIDSTQFLETDSLPNRIAFIGGGYISFEFAHIARRAGAAVAIFHRGRDPLNSFDPDLVAQLVDTTRDLGVQLYLDTAVQAIERRSNAFLVHATGVESARVEEVDLVVHGAGRVPDIQDLDLEKGGVRFENAGVTVNEFLQSVSNSAVYAAGDCAALPVPRLTPVSGMEGDVAADNLLKGNHRRPDFAEVPSVVFTIPPLASVGLLENKARRLGLRFRTNLQDTSGWYSSRRLAIRQSGSKVLVEEPGERILGAHLFGPHADELINLFAVAVRFNLTTKDLHEMLFAYPTGASDIDYLI